jgi:hypothetical protein
MILLQVWLGLIIAIICVITILNLLQRYLEYRSQFETGPNPKNLRKLPIVGDIHRPLNRRRRIVAMVGSLFVPSGISLREARGQTGNQYLYVFGNLLSQGLTFNGARGYQGVPSLP